MITQVAVTSLAVAIAERRRSHPASGIYAGRSRAVLMRNATALRTSNLLPVLTGFVEPVLFLVAFGFGIGALVGGVQIQGSQVSYAAFIAPALLASSAMNGAIFDSTYNVYFKMHYSRIYQGMLATSLGPLDVAIGEIGWAVLRGGAYALGFMVVAAGFGLIPGASALLAIPAALLIALAFSAVAMSITSFMSSFQQLNWLSFWMLPMFLFSGNFFPISDYPDWLRMIVEVTPLAQAIAMVRSVWLGDLGPSLAGNVLYFAILAVIGVTLTSRRLTSLFLR
jgi:lipooligosaccharide transport system permease protein